MRVSMLLMRVRIRPVRRHAVPAPSGARAKATLGRQARGCAREWASRDFTNAIDYLNILQVHSNNWQKYNGKKRPYATPPSDVRVGTTPRQLAPPRPAPPRGPWCPIRQLGLA